MTRRHTRYLVHTLLGGILLSFVPPGCDGAAPTDTAAPAEPIGSAASAVGPCPAPFAPQVDYATNDAARSITAADLNGDGFPDLVLPDGYSGFSILFNQGNGTFAAPVAYLAGDAVGDITEQVTAADLNGDGKPDLVVSCAYGNVEVLLNQGNGAFAAPVAYRAGVAAYAVVAADLNGDGQPDLAVSDDIGHTVSVLLNQGNGTFGAAVAYAAGGDPLSLAAADLNSDGFPDLAVANAGTTTVSVLLNHGDGTFAAPIAYPAGSRSYSVAAADLNGDGFPDLAVGNVYTGVSVLLNQGNGTFTAPVAYPLAGFSFAVAAADLNGDGFPDLVVTDYGTGVSVLLNQGDGTFAAPARHDAGEYAYCVTVADLNGDGKPDLAVYDHYNEVVNVLLNTSTCSPDLCAAPCAALDPCHVAGVCDPSTGVCSNPTAADGTPCTDGHACTVGDTCTAGACVGGPLSNAPACATQTVTIQRAGASGTVFDTLLAENGGATTFGASASLPVGAVGAASRVTLLSFDLSAIPAGAFVTSATATLYVYLSSGMEDSRAHVVTAPWSESTVTWSTFDFTTYQAAVGATFPGVADVVSGAVPVTADFTAMVRGWYSGAMPNDGVLLEANRTPATMNLTKGTAFDSSEYGTVANRPALTVTYIPND